jgi:hypothetical protein
MTRQVRTHTRRTASGKTTTVHQHNRRGDKAEEQKVKRKRGPNPGHAGRMGKKAFIHGKRHRKGKAAAFALLAAGEITAWATLSGTSVILALVAGLLAGVSIVLVK